jgi:nitrous oxide reductase accessory protein NosL
VLSVVEAVVGMGGGEASPTTQVEEGAVFAHRRGGEALEFG